MTVLRGPADADHFRVKVGRYGDRWYHDPLPACDVAPACTDEWPSVSIVKNAWPKFLTSWAASEAAKYAADNLSTLAQLDRAAVIALVSKAHDRSRDGAASRGTAVHAIVEALSEGREPDPLIEAECADWSEAARKVVADIEPEWLLSEAVVINRQLGCGGTLDAVWRISGKTYVVDFKSRAVGKHGAYQDEAAQLGAYASAGYCIVERDGRAARQRLPHIDAGLIVSICPDGYRLYPIDIDAAREDFAVLRGFWQRMQDSKPIGKPIVLRNDDSGSGVREPRVVPPVPPSPAASEATVAPGSDVTPQPQGSAMPLELARERVGFVIEHGHGADLAAIWPSGLPTLRQGGLTDEQCADVVRLCQRVEQDHALPFFAPSSADKVADKYALLAEFPRDEALALADAAAPGKDLTNFNDDDVARLRALIEDVDRVKRGFTYDGDRPRLVAVP